MAKLNFSGLTPGFDTPLTQRPVMDLFSGLSLDPNEGPTPSGIPAPTGQQAQQGGFWGTLQAVLPDLINAGAAWYGNKQMGDQYQAAANQSVGKPFPVSSPYGSMTFDPRTGLSLTPGAGPGPWAGASPELIGAFNQLNDQGAIAQEAQGRLGLLRQLAAPEEQRATNTLTNQLYAQGRLGGTGGAVQQEALARAQAQADLQRQLSSMDWANQNALQRFNAAGNVVGSGQQQQNLGFGQLRDLAQLGIQAGRPPAADLLAAMAGSRGAGLQAIFGALGGNDDRGIGGPLVDIFGKVFGRGQPDSKLQLLGQLGNDFAGQLGGNLGQGLGGLSQALAGYGSRDIGGMASGVGSLLQSFGQAAGADSGFGGLLNSLGGIAGKLGGILSPASSALGMGGMNGIASLVGGVGGGSGMGFLGGLQGLAGGGGAGIGSLGSLGAMGPLGAALGVGALLKNVLGGIHDKNKYDFADINQNRVSAGLAPQASMFARAGGVRQDPNRTLGTDPQSVYAVNQENAKRSRLGLPPVYPPSWDQNNLPPGAA